MNTVRLDTKMKLMHFDNSVYSFDTSFLCEIPAYIHHRYNTSDFLVKCSLLNHYTMHYQFIDNNGQQLPYSDFSQECITQIENVLWGLSTYREVFLYENTALSHNNNNNNNNKKMAVLIKNDLSIK